MIIFIGTMHDVFLWKTLPKAFRLKWYSHTHEWITVRLGIITKGSLIMRIRSGHVCMSVCAGSFHSSSGHTLQLEHGMTRARGAGTPLCWLP